MKYDKSLPEEWQMTDLEKARMNRDRLVGFYSIVTLIVSALALIALVLSGVGA